MVTESTASASSMLAKQDGDVQPSDLPAVWTMTLFNNHVKTKPWLLCRSGKLGCKVCSEIGHFNDMQKKGRGRNIQAAWATCNIQQNGLNTSSQLSSLRKKMKEHQESEAHIRANTMVNNKFTAADNPLKRKFDEGFSHLSETTSKCFLTVYKAVKYARPFLDYEADIELQQLNGVKLGRILHSDVTCANITSHIAIEVKKKLVKSCVQSKTQFSVLLDESTSLSKKSCLIVYIRMVIPGSNKPVSFFLDLVELASSSANGIKEALLMCLFESGFDETYCQQYWLGITTDGCSTMLGKQNGLVALLQRQFPKLVPWHCAAHRLELAVADALKDVSATNHFKIFLEKLYSTYSMSAKNSRELAEAADAVSVELLKIGKVFSIRWVASTVRTVRAVWQNYPALFEHFSKAAVDKTRSSSEQANFSGLANQLSSEIFVKNLALMFDTLSELSVLSQQLQSNDMNIQTAHNKFLLTKKIFSAMKGRSGKCETVVDNCGGCFKGVELNGSLRRIEINRSQFIQSVIDKLDERMFTTSSNRNSDNSASRELYEKIIVDLSIIQKENWSAEQLNDPGFGDEVIERLCNFFRVPCDPVIQGFREYVFSGGKNSKGVHALFQAINLIAIQTAECERGFSAMNRILTPERASMSVRRLSHCLRLYTVGPPLSLFNPNEYVKSWLSKGGHLADDINSVGRKKKSYAEHEFFDLWKLM